MLPRSDAGIPVLERLLLPTAQPSRAKRRRPKTVRPSGAPAVRYHRRRAAPPVQDDGPVTASAADGPRVPGRGGHSEERRQVPRNGLARDGPRVPSVPVPGPSCCLAR